MFKIFAKESCERNRYVEEAESEEGLEQSAIEERK